MLGMTMGKLIIYLRREHREAVGYDNFLGLGLIGLAYGSALMLHVYGFLVVVTAGLTLRQVEQKATATAASMPFQPSKRWQRLGRCRLM